MTNSADNTASLIPASQLMHQALEAAMKLIAEMEQQIEYYDDLVSNGDPVDLDNVGWMYERVSDLKRAAEGFSSSTLA